MLVSYNWLKEFVEGLPPATELAERLTMTGTEVEAVTDLSGGIKGVVTAEVLSVAKHPNADKLKLCSVNTGAEELQIVCGASNMAAGDRVALAVHGATLPGGARIKKSKIRGVESNGMMCSEVELGLADTSDGIMILAPETPLGVDIASALALDDFIFDVGVTPNRADLLSVRGLAREAAAVIDGAVFKDKPGTDLSGVQAGGRVSVEIKKGAPCGRYTGIVISGVKVGPSDERIAARLAAHGIRPVNNVVDATNYALIELGCPMHAFDLGKLQGDKITVRMAAGGETIETIDNKERGLSEEMLVIADGSGPVAVAGVMGGASTEVTGSTTEIFLECAWFEPSTVRRTSRALGLSSESSFRFERGVDIQAVPGALAAAAAMIIDTAGGSVTQAGIDEFPGGPVPAGVRFRLERARRLLGIELGAGEAAGYFEKLGMDVSGPDAEGALTVTPPSYRMDITAEVDLLEEAARLYGYDKIDATLPGGTLEPGSGVGLSAFRRRVAGQLAATGLTEVMNYSFVSPAAVGAPGTDGPLGLKILNPLSEDQSVMRTALVPTLLENLGYNIARQAQDVNIFEIAPVFTPTGEGQPEERWKVAGLMYGGRLPASWSTPGDKADFFDALGAIERLAAGLGVKAPLVSSAAVPPGHLHPGKYAELKLAGKALGFLAEAHPDTVARLDAAGPVSVFELDLGLLFAMSGAVPKYSGLARFPASTRDVAFIVDRDTPYGNILRAVEKIDAKLIEKVELFDVYYGGHIPAGKKSMALRVRYRSKDGTLTQAVLEDIHSRVVAELTSRFSAEVRGEPEGL